jgi:DNA repair photolyase
MPAAKVVQLKPKTDLDTSYTSPRWSGEIADCSMPMTFDQYSRCSFDCLYCFSFFQRALKKYNTAFDSNDLYTEELPSTVDVERISQLFDGKATGDKKQFQGYVAQRIAMQWGGLSDPFDMFEKKYGIGLKIMQYLHAIKYPICFSTKGTWWMDDERYAKLFRGNDFWNVKISIINMNAERAKLMERGVPSPTERLIAMDRLVHGNTAPFTHKDKNWEGLGGGVTLRLRPFIIGYSDIDDEYIDLLHHAANAGATAVSTEFFCMEGRCTPESTLRFNAMSEIIGYDLIDFYRRNSTRASGYMRLNYGIKQPFIEKMEAVCKSRKMRFYVSDAHHKDKCNNGCCCGLPDNWNYSRGQFTQALMVAKAVGSVCFADMAAGFPPGWDTIKVCNAFGLNVARGNPRDRARFKDFTIADYIRYLWNTPNHPRSPYMYFHGLLHPDKINGAGDVVYRYTPYPEK